MSFLACSRSPAHSTIWPCGSALLYSCRVAIPEPIRLLAFFLGVSMYTYWNCRLPCSFNVPNTSRMIFDCQGMTLNGCPWKSPISFRWLINAIARSASFASNIPLLSLLLHFAIDDLGHLALRLLLRLFLRTYSAPRAWRQ